MSVVVNPVMASVKVTVTTKEVVLVGSLSALARKTFGGVESNSMVVFPIPASERLPDKSVTTPARMVNETGVSWHAV